MKQNLSTKLVSIRIYIFSLPRDKHIFDANRSRNIPFNIQNLTWFAFSRSHRGWCILACVCVFAFFSGHCYCFEYCRKKNSIIVTVNKTALDLHTKSSLFRWTDQKRIQWQHRCVHKIEIDKKVINNKYEATIYLYISLTHSISLAVRMDVCERRAFTLYIVDSPKMPSKRERK